MQNKRLDKLKDTLGELKVVDTKSSPKVKQVSKLAKAVKVEEVIEKPKPIAKAKPIPCYIHICVFKCLPEILFQQLRFEVFPDLPQAQNWCEEYCSQYEIRDHKLSKPLVKVK